MPFESPPPPGVDPFVMVSNDFQLEPIAPGVTSRKITPRTGVFPRFRVNGFILFCGFRTEIPDSVPSAHRRDLTDTCARVNDYRPSSKRINLFSVIGRRQ